MAETNYVPEPRTTPLTWPASRELDATITGGSLHINRKAADTLGAEILTTKQGALVNDVAPVVFNNGIFQIRAEAWDGAAFVDAGRIQINAAETFSTTAHGTYFRFQAPFIGATLQQEVFRIQPNAADVEIQLMSTKVIGVRNTGWTTFIGTANKNAGALDTGTVTTAQLAQVVKSMMDALILHGLIGT